MAVQQEQWPLTRDQEQSHRSGIGIQMTLRPVSQRLHHHCSANLQNKVALIRGGLIPRDFISEENCRQSVQCNVAEPGGPNVPVKNASAKRLSATYSLPQTMQLHCRTGSTL
jgi:hypothetical protein